MRFGNRRKPSPSSSSSLTRGTIDASVVKTQALMLVADLRRSLDRLEAVLESDPVQAVKSDNEAPKEDSCSTPTP